MEQEKETNKEHPDYDSITFAQEQKWDYGWDDWF